MATENETQVAPEETNETALTILSMIGGLGITIMVVAAGFGVVLEDIDSGLIGLLVMVGLGLLVAGVAGWTLIVRPYENFDDINQPMYHGHHHDDHDAHDMVAEEHLNEPGEVNVEEDPVH